MPLFVFVFYHVKFRFHEADVVFFFVLFISSCDPMHDATLHITFTSQQKDTIRELKAVFLKNIDTDQMENTKDQSFGNIKSDKPNEFVIKKVISGKYLGLIKVNKNGQTYNITLESLMIKPGENYITREINLGSIDL